MSRVETLSLVRGGLSGTSRACLSLLLPLLCLESLLNSRVEKEVQVQEGCTTPALVAIGFYNSVP